MNLPLTLAVFALGILAWTLLEYVIHRWLGHDRRFTGSNGFGREHVLHHADGNHFAHPWKKAVFVALALAVVLPLAVLAGGVVHGAVFTAGLLGVYPLYEWIHRRMHTHAGLGRYGRMLRRHHFFHHFHDPKANFGVSSPLWDIVFGTWVRPARIGLIRVPKKTVMPWLLDRDGHPHPEHRADYVLR